MPESNNDTFNNSNNFNSNNGFYGQQDNEFVNNDDLYNQQLNNVNNKNIENNEKYYSQQNAGDSGNQDCNIVDTKFENQNIKKVGTNLFWLINMKVIVPAVFVFGLVFAIGSALSGSSGILSNLILTLCFGYSILMVILFIIHWIRNVHNDIQQNGFSIFGKTTKDKIKSIAIISIVIFYLIMYLVGKFK